MKPLAFVLASALALGANAATPVIEPLGMSSYRMDWEGATNETYFIQWSFDLQSWQYFPVIDHGVEHDEFNFNSSSEKFFVRLVVSDIPTSDPHGADFDGDGLSNIFELMNGLDPVRDDTDGDGIIDGAEDFDGDGALNTTEQLAGRNPNAKDNPGVKLSVVVGN